MSTKHLLRLSNAFPLQSLVSYTTCYFLLVIFRQHLYRTIWPVSSHSSCNALKSFQLDLLIVLLYFPVHFMYYSLHFFSSVLYEIISSLPLSFLRIQWHRIRLLPLAQLLITKLSCTCCVPWALKEQTLSTRFLTSSSFL